MKHLLQLTAAIATAMFVSLAAHAKDPMTERLRDLKGTEFDQAFVKHMIEHHKQAIEMADMAKQRALNPAVKQFAEKTQRSQKMEIDELKELGGGHHASTHQDRPASAATLSANSDKSPHTSRHEQMKRETMAKLESARGAEFDQTFVEVMTKHHQMASEMNELAERQASSDELRRFAEKAIKSQKEEIAELKRLKR